MFLVNVAERCDAMTFRAPIVFEPPEPREQAGKDDEHKVRIRLCPSRRHQGMKVYINTVRVNSNSVCGPFHGQRSREARIVLAPASSPPILKEGFRGYRSGVPPLA